MKHSIVVLTGLITLVAAPRALGADPAHAQARPVDFSRSIRPILSDACFTCHGPDPDKRKKDLRLDTRAGALGPHQDGPAVVIPGKPEESALFQRITAQDPDDLMPPAASGKKLTPEQVEQLRQWIATGAEWKDHWAFVPPVYPPVPTLDKPRWVRNPIDNFVLARLEREGLTPSPPADKETLIRRLSLDLTGLPPTPAEVDAFLKDKAPGDFERLLNRLLASPRYGEHMARYWLDAARYGDTHGLHLDNERSIWPYRDWVVQAFNTNQPFDQFTIEQLAGDLLPGPSREQLVATGFNRCLVTTSEGGAIPEEFAARYAVDRVETVSAVWLGLTAGCAACHDHKYDPLSQKEFYQLFAFFNSLDEDPMDGNALHHPPTLRLATPEQAQRLASFEERVAASERQIRASLDRVDYKDPTPGLRLSEVEPVEFVWVDDELPDAVKASEGGEGWTFAAKADGPVFSGESAVVRTAEGTSQQHFAEARWPLRIAPGDRLFVHVYLDPAKLPKEIMVQFNTGNWEHRAFWGEDLIEYGTKESPSRRRLGDLPEGGKWVRLEIDPVAVGLEPGVKVSGLALTQHGGTVRWDRAGILSRVPQARATFASLSLWESYQRTIKEPDLPEAVRKAVKEEPAKRGPDQRRAIREYFVQEVNDTAVAVFEPLRATAVQARKERDEFEQPITKTMITRELPAPRPTHVLKRGQYDQKGDPVTPDVPAVLPRIPQGAPANRLGLARWLVDPAHPLTARVTVNRIWQQHFGTGLVKTSENFGSQGDPPSHPELLDWLAREFIASGWDVKRLHRLIATSATYRQDSRTTPQLAARDPENRLLAHGPRFRLDAEVIRDNALAVSGLLVERPGGRGTRPYQPDGIWEAVAYPTSTTARYQQDAPGEALYRRTLYTFWKRTAPPPTITTFDAPNRESCRVRRERTNTPLQALALLNDIQQLEAARHLAGRMLREGGASTEDQLAYGFRLATARWPDAYERKVLRQLQREQEAAYRTDREAAWKLIRLGDSAPDPGLDPSELAAWTMVANTILNLSETITIN